MSKTIADQNLLYTSIRFPPFVASTKALHDPKANDDQFMMPAGMNAVIWVCGRHQLQAPATCQPASLPARYCRWVLARLGTLAGTWQPGGSSF